jgi:hypothetical protein
MSPFSLPHLIIEIENKFMIHFYSRNYKMKLRSGEESHPSRIIFIWLSKRLNDYYASMT